jgi:integrase
VLKLTKRHGSPNWTARGTYLGVAIDQSLGTGDRRQAEFLIAKIQAEIFERQTRGPVPVAEGFAAVALRYMENGGERRYVAPLLRHFGDMPIDRISQQAIDGAAITLYPRAGSSTRDRQVYTPMSAILKSGGVKTQIKRPRPTKGVIRWLTHDEARCLIAACSPHLKPLVHFLLMTGARAGEALWLDWRCVDLARAHVSFPKTKNGDARGVPLHRDLVATLANLPHRDGLVFRRPDGKPYRRRVECLNVVPGTSLERPSRELSGVPGWQISGFMTAAIPGRHGITPSTAI